MKKVVFKLFLLLAVTGCSVTGSSKDFTEERSLKRVVPGVENTFNVMAPLKVVNWNEFKSDLATVKNYGVDAVSVDVWWGDVESQDDVFNWSYYDSVFAVILEAGLDIVPIMSFHQCGGNVGDDYTSYLPSWVWFRFPGVTPEDLKYRSETGAYSAEYISLWADHLIIDEYLEFMNAFEDHYGYLKNDIDEINISGGPAGELRYPSYNSHDWGGYGNRGTLQAYGSFARDDFRNDMLAKYGSLWGVNSAWGINLTSSYQITPPSNPDWFFNNWDYVDTSYGRDFIDWYNQSLKEHGERMIGAAITAFNGDFSNIEIGMKIAGVHWEMVNPLYPRLAEITAGFIKVSDDYQSDSTGHGYRNIISAFSGYNRHINLHFTCLEKGNEYGDAHSTAENLVFWVAQEAARQNVTIKGENALSGGVQSDYGWDKIHNAFTWASYTGLTVLRLHDVSYGTGAYRYSGFINQFR